MLAAAKRFVLSKPLPAMEIQAKLRADGVPLSEEPCRNCPNPCDEEHEPYPSRFDVDMDSQLLGTVKPYAKQCVISTGKTDWPKDITDAKGTFASHLNQVYEQNKQDFIMKDVETRNRKPLTTPGVFTSSNASRLSVLNGSHAPNDASSEVDSVLIFPDYKLVTVPSNYAGATLLWNRYLSLLPSTSTDSNQAQSKTWILPYACVILLCSHRRRDNRCGIAAPKLQDALLTVLQAYGWEVSTQLDHVETMEPPLERHEDNQETRERVRHQYAKRALILMNSHIGGHKFAGNMTIYTPTGAGVWYGRVTTHNVEPIVQQTIIKGTVLPELLRGGINLDRKNLLSW